MAGDSPFEGEDRRMLVGARKGGGCYSGVKGLTINYQHLGSDRVNLLLIRFLHRFLNYSAILEGCF